MGRLEAVEKLRALNVFPDTLEESAEIFRAAQTEEDVRQEMIRRKTSCSSEQYIFFHFSELLRRQPNLLQEAEQRLANLGVPPDVTREYMQAQQQPSYLMAMSHEEIPDETRVRFSKAANQFALDKIKEYLEVT